MKRVISIVLALLFLFSACGTSGGTSTDENLGIYKMKSISGISVDAFAEMMDLDVSAAGEYMMAELKSGGKCDFIVDGETQSLKWSLDGDTITMTDGTDTLSGTLIDGVITLDMEGEILVLAKDGAGDGGQVASGLKQTLRGKLEAQSVPAPSPDSPAEPEPSEEPAPAGEPEPSNEPEPSPEPEPADAPEPDPSSAEAPSGDGLLSTEDVMKGYVWMSEILGLKAYDLTYEDLAAHFGVDGHFDRQEFNENMDSNYRYYDWISREDDTVFLHINLREKNKDGIYYVSGYNSSGFTGSEAAELYLEELQAEANAAAANAPVSALEVQIHPFGERDLTATMTVSLPEDWNYKDVSGEARFYNHPTETSFNYGGGVEVVMETELAKLTDKLATYDNVQSIGQRTIGGIAMDGYTYESIGYSWTEYQGTLPGGQAVAVQAVDIPCEPGTPAGNLIDSIAFQ